MAAYKGLNNRHEPDAAYALAERALKKQVPVDQLPLSNLDKRRAEELRTAAKAKLLTAAGFTTEDAVAELSPVKIVTPERKAALLALLQARFTKSHKNYCEGINPEDVQKALKAATERQWYGLHEMEENYHQVRVVRAVGIGRKKGFRFDSCAQSSPLIRNINYYEAEDIAQKWGIDLMAPEVFKDLRIKYGINDHTWDHVKTPAAMLRDGRSLFGNSDGVQEGNAGAYNENGSCRGSLWIPEAA